MKGNIWSVDQLPVNCVINDEIKDLVEEVKTYLLKEKSRPVLISGEFGVGKSTLINIIAHSFMIDGIKSVTVSGPNLKAGNKYIGMIEQVVEKFMSQLKDNNQLWIAPEFLQIYYAAKHDDDPMGVLDMITPYLRKGEIKLIGEISESDLETLLTLQPEVKNLFEIYKLLPYTKTETFELTKDWIKLDEQPEKWVNINDERFDELYFISRQYLSYQENPGALINFLKYTKDKYRKKKEAYNMESFYEALSTLTGLPISILNDNEKLDLDELRTHFNTKVVGQEEAVNVIVERIAMIKAGLTDPSKPLAVLLFVGPTGTGKTEIAKMLAEYLFSSSERMIRLDMSEFQSQDSLNKIFGNYASVHRSYSLVNEIRKNPFSVILLDEFEKAHPGIWDLFLQIFDDGRLSDSQGSNVDFRQSIIIMTSNIGAAIPVSKVARRQVGFNKVKIEKKEEVYDPMQSVMQSVNMTFRPEFVNRIDKIVVFNPLSRAALSVILDIELRKVLLRRGLRNKKWALDMEDSAIEYLLEKGYTTNLGARPLKRAIEQYLLAPLATTIVNHNFPKGDQFLLVSKSKGDKLKVQFVDPDEPDYTWEEKIKLEQFQKERSQTLNLKIIIKDTYGSLAEFTCIKNEFLDLEKEYTASGIRSKKEKLMEEIAHPDFWQSENKNESLSRIEYYDRFNAAFESTQSLLERLDDPEKVRLKFDPSILKKLAQKIYLLKTSLRSYIENEAQDTLLKISYEKQNEDWGDRIQKMYVDWAKKRKMKFKKVCSGNEKGQEFIIFLFSGFGSYAILKNEHGSHLWETKAVKGKMIEKMKSNVSVLPFDSTEYHIADQPKEIIKKFQDVPNGKVVRRFNLKTKQCKDLVNKWQTGHIEKILKGMFDVMN